MGKIIDFLQTCIIIQQGSFKLMSTLPVPAIIFMCSVMLLPCSTHAVMYDILTKFESVHLTL